MISLNGKQVYLACGSTDMRKSINGLTIIVQNSFELDPFMSAVFVFCNGTKNRVKILEWDGDGFWLYLKRLEHGHFKWPVNSEEKTMMLTDDDLRHLLAGPGLEQKLHRIKIGKAIA